ncbi:MAG: N5-carboxyaminoimidazole ribonucleotide synthase [Elusimicrobia bacterium]|nr:N5-carboxyaminoimidazole ribonucleotide synthase [Elusimicrobiota bacterium]
MTQSPSSRPLLPGSTIGVLGSGQLGRMFAIAARQMGYRVHTFSPDTDTPAGQVSDKEWKASYDNHKLLTQFSKSVDVVTFEFENIPVSSVQVVAQHTRVHPKAQVLYISQNRWREKNYLASHGFPVAPFQKVGSLGELTNAIKKIGFPCVLKTAGFGYDGKGQRKVGTWAEAETAFKSFNGAEAILEGFVSFEKELSIIAVRGSDGAVDDFGVMENIHRQHILDMTLSPARVSPSVEKRACRMAQKILKSLDVVGVMCVEMFLEKSGKLIVNELAPRPHNSGHLTINAFQTSQFEQQLRAVCGLPLGSTERLAPAVMVNLLGNEWLKREPHWERALRVPGVHLHLYGKDQARAGRKMGHITATGHSLQMAQRAALAARRAL